MIGVSLKRYCCRVLLDRHHDEVVDKMGEKEAPYGSMRPWRMA